MNSRDHLKQRLMERILDQLLGNEGPLLKRSIARRVAEKIALEIIRNRLSSWQPVHIGTYNLAYLFGELQSDLSKTIIEQICKEMFYGHVIPLQEVKQVIEEANRVYMGICACRISKRTQDLYTPSASNKDVYTHVDKAESRRLMDTILDVFHTLQQQGNDYETGKEMVDFFHKMDKMKMNRDPLYGIEQFWELTYPNWELLVEHGTFTPVWKESQQKNQKVRPIHKQLLIPIVDALYISRGIIFSCMSMFDAKYAICSCPGPENDKGCLLFNWHYYSGIEPAIQHNVDRGFGQRKDAGGQVLPCDKYVERGEMACLGCGCDHKDEPEETQ